MGESERVTIRLPPEMLKHLRELVERGEYKNISDVIRASLQRFIEEQVSPPNIEKITVEFPKGNVIKLEELVHGGDAISINDAIREAVREYIRNRFEYALRDYTRLKSPKYKGK